jgi:hypothetical protein
MNRVISYVSTAAIVLLLCASFAGAGAFTTTWSSATPTTIPANGDIFSNYTGTNLAIEAITASSATPSLSKKVAQTFTVGSSAITMDKFAFQIRSNTTSNVVLYADSNELLISLYQMTGPTEYLQDFNAPSRPATDTMLLTTWASLLPAGINSNAPGGTGAKYGYWLTFDLDNYALAANTTYALSFEFTTTTYQGTYAPNIMVERCGEKDSSLIYPGSYYTGGGSSLWGKTGSGYNGQKWDPDGGKDMDIAVIATPEPTTICLLSLGSLLLFRRKRS